MVNKSKWVVNYDGAFTSVERVAHDDPHGVSFKDAKREALAYLKGKQQAFGYGIKQLRAITEDNAMAHGL